MPLRPLGVLLFLFIPFATFAETDWGRLQFAADAYYTSREDIGLGAELAVQTHLEPLKLLVGFDFEHAVDDKGLFVSRLNAVYSPRSQYAFIGANSAKSGVKDFFGFDPLVGGQLGIGAILTEHFALELEYRFRTDVNGLIARAKCLF